MTKGGTARARSDRWSDWAVILALAVALLLGWGVMAYAQGQRESFTDAGTGLTVSYPRGWLLKGDDKLAFQALDPATSGFRTTYQVKVWPIMATESLTQSLGVLLNDASLARAQQGTAFRLLDLLEGDAVNGQPAMEAEYVYVVEGSDLFVQQLPVVVRGLDVAIRLGDRGFVFSLLASEKAYADAVSAFRDFVGSATLK